MIVMSLVTTLVAVLIPVQFDLNQKVIAQIIKAST
jgi:hypothetical protein